MSSGVKGAVRVSISSSVEKMIENIKDITGQNHTEDEIYAMLKECSMDPNEALQKLLLLGGSLRCMSRAEEVEVESKPAVEAKLGIKMADDNAVDELSHPHLGGRGSNITRPISEANDFEPQPAVLQMIQLWLGYGGSDSEDPNAHLERFLAICDTIKYNGVLSIDTIRLRLFPFSLTNRALEWLEKLPSESITTWDTLAELFVHKFFSIGKMIQLYGDINSFKQKSGESMKEAWARFRRMLRMCPHLYGFPLRQQIQTFYYGLEPKMRALIDVAAGGSLNAALEILNRMASNNLVWPNPEQEKSVAEILKVEAIAALTARTEKLACLIVSMQANHTPLGSYGNQQGAPSFRPTVCGGESMNFVGNQDSQQYNPYSSSCNIPGWRNRPNFPWRNNDNVLNPPMAVNAPPKFNQAQEHKPDFEELIMKYMSENETRWQNQEAMQKLEAQIYQIASQIGQIAMNAPLKFDQAQEH